jgi:general secretion pathway protein E
MSPAADVELRPFNAEDIRQARAEAARRGARVIAVLEEGSRLAAADFVAALAQATRYRPASMAELHSWQPAFDLLPYTDALARECVLFRAGEQLIMVHADPFAADLKAWAEEAVRMAFEWRLAHHSDIAAFLARQEETMSVMPAALASGGGTTSDRPDIEELSLLAIAGEDSAVVKLVRSTLYDAMKLGASDVHLESGHNALVIKYRIDGVLTTVGTVQGIETAEQAISRIKVMAELDIAERRVPQDGRFKASLRGREVDFRVSIMPSIFGEDAVLRILDKDSLADHVMGLRLESLGFDPQSLLLIRRLANEPYGMLLVTGPTGSGKTTTLYAAITEINHGRDKIVTIEDPVEYQLPGVLQIPVNEKKGLSFARGLRSILRHDPDKIMVGEIRDAETAQIGVQSALTGHLVFTTVHANNAFDVIGRFIHMGVEPYSFVAAINGIVAQRLVRQLCASCAVAEQPDAMSLQMSGIAPAEAASFTFRAGRGCGQCRGTGFRGRRAIAEILLLTDELREKIVAREPIRQVKALARANGTRFLRERALDLVRGGETSLAEANRVTAVA